MDLRRRTSTSSSVARKRDRSLFVKGGGPPMASPPARRSAMIALVAIAEPIELGVNGLPFGAMTLRSEEHTSELQSLMRISYAVFCLKKKTNNKTYDKTK